MTDFPAHYRVLSELGSGGMGKVYKALDTRMQRHVALKILRPELVRDSEKVRRFRQEAKAVSTLNHPAIVTILDVGDDGFQYIAMEYVEGESLRQKLRQHLPLNKRLELIANVADGMAVAHSAGVVHRDLKPDNIIVTPHGQPKIVDFGLAKLIQPELLSEPGKQQADTVSLHASREGSLIGTVGYMSPEQIEGKRVDHRCDVFALGCILYEIVTGRRAFQSDSIVDTLHKIVHEQPPPVLDTNSSLPPDLERIVRRCLAKDPDDRYQSIKEVAIELRDVLRGSSAPEVRPRSRSWRRWSLYAAALLAVAGLSAWLISRQSDSSRHKFTPLATDAAYEGFPSWSPDGRAVAYVRDVDGILQIFVRSLDSPMAAQLTRAARDCREPFWHPRGDRIFFISQAAEGDALWSVGTGGGSPEVVLTDVSAADISPDGQSLALLRSTGRHGTFRLNLWISSPPGAEPRPYTEGDLSQQSFTSAVARFSPDGSKIGFWAVQHLLDPMVGKIPAGNRSFEGVFWILPYPEGARRRVSLQGGAAALSFRFSWMPDSRHIVFGGELPEADGAHLWLMDTGRGGVSPLTTGHGSESDPAVAPDGRRIAFSSERGDYDLVAIDLERRHVAPFLATTRLERSPAASRSGNEIAYVTNRSGKQEVWLRSEDGAWERPIVSNKDFRGDATLLLGNIGFSPDGQRIAYQRWGSAGIHHVWISPIAGGPAVPLLPGVGYQDSPTWSPDGNWIAYVATSPEGFALRKVRVGSEDQPVLIREGVVYPSAPHWSPRGDWITVETPDGFAITSSDGSTTRVLLAETVLAHEWSSDGSRIYAVRLSEDFHMVISSIDISTGEETEIVDLGISPPVIDPVAGLTVSNDDKRLFLGVRRLEGDIWMLEGFQ
ncbi:MAG TPA: protein kinase [Thermoanaerobaculia bacterium]|nr:protein kinase [Thermoanaerobaculia bacterium]